MRIVKFTCDWASKRLNWLDWVRTVYFSLLGASLLSFCFKIPSLLSNYSIIFFSLGILFFIIGCWASAEIFRRFKKLEGDYNKKTYDEKLKLTPESFLLNNESTNYLSLINFQHIAFYLSWLIALILVIISIRIEFKSDKNVSRIIEKLIIIESQVQHTDSLLQVIDSGYKKQQLLQTSLDKLSKNFDWQTSQIDSLIKIQTLSGKLKRELNGEK